MTCQIIQSFALESRSDNISPTKTAATPPNPPAMKDLADSVAETRLSSAAGASLLYNRGINMNIANEGARDGPL
jgi:hypothetical protein